MLVADIHALLNDTMEEVTGQSALVEEDLSNVVDIGKMVFTADDINNNYKDAYVKSLLNRIGRMVFVDRKYDGYAPKVIKDAWEYGSIMSKSRVKVFDAETNPAWTLTNGQTVNQFEYNAPSVETKFYNEKTSWQIACSFTDIQLRQSFTSPTEMNRFLSMIENRIAMSMTVYIDNMIMRTINNFIAEKINGNNGVVDLLAAYIAAGGDSTLTAATALYDKEFLRFAAMTVMLYKSRLNAPSTLFNISTNNDNVTFTPDDRMHLVFVDNFAKAVDVYLQSDTYHNELTSIGGYETVPYWQGSGTSYALADVTKIYLESTASGTAFEKNMIVGVLFDEDALGVLNENRRTTSSYNANGEYYNNFYKCDTTYFNDLAENGIIFMIGTGAA